MKRIVCKHGSTEPGRITVSIDRGNTLVILRGVPASVCSTCGEELLSAEVVRQIEAEVDAAERAGRNLELQQYRAA